MTKEKRTTHFVRNADEQGNKRRRELIALLLLDSFTFARCFPKMSEADENDLIIRCRFPLIIETNAKTIHTMGNVTCAAAAATMGAIETIDEFLRFYRGKACKSDVLPVESNYTRASMHPFKGKCYYDTGELCYEGDCVMLSWGQICPCGHGTEYYKDGTVKQQGLFQRRGLVSGRMYYPSGKLKFEGYCREPSGYGPAYPTTGTFYDEEGNVLYTGAFQIRTGGVGYPTVVIPEGFGSLT